MLDTINLPLILAAAFVASASPGPATLAIADTSMQAGRRAGLALASGVSTGSLLWSVAAAMGLATVMASHGWALEILRYLGAAYLMFLAFKSARNVLKADVAASSSKPEASLSRAYAKGLALHLTNLKAILFFGSLYSLGISPQTSPGELATIIAAVGLQSILIFHFYAWLFSNARIAQSYVRLRRWFEAAFALAFAGASLKVLTSRLS